MSNPKNDASALAHELECTPREAYIRFTWSGAMMSGRSATIEDLLGFKPIATDTRLALAYSIQAGLPVSALDHLAEAVAPDDTRFKFRLIPKATLERRRRSHKPLTTDEGDRLARIAKVFSIGLDIYRDPVKLREFLGRPHMMLDNKAPMDVALGTGPGADAVINLLGRAAYGGGV
jgi:putative toxin-antitoxin system antitoxin component (TIGR02293 family)